MGTNTLPRDYDIGRMLADYERRISFLERQLLALAYLTPEFTATQGCRVTRNAVQSIAHAAFIAVSFNTELFDNNAMHDNGVNPTRITINVPGIYQVGGNIEMEAGNDYTRVIMRILQNGGTAIAFNATAGTTQNVAQRFALGTTYEFAAGDYVELQIHQTNTAVAARNVLATPEYSPQFWAVRIGG
jgi:hypothetical protein